jgi:evolved beta-galactosidase subunit alpha
MKNNEVVIKVDSHFAPPVFDFGFEISYIFKINLNGAISIKLNATKYGEFRKPETSQGSGKIEQAADKEKSKVLGQEIMIPKVGLELGIDHKINKVSFFGLGPNENYADSREAAYLDL